MLGGLQQVGARPVPHELLYRFESRVRAAAAMPVPTPVSNTANQNAPAPARLSVEGNRVTVGGSRDLISASTPIFTNVALRGKRLMSTAPGRRSSRFCPPACLYAVVSSTGERKTDGAPEDTFIVGLETWPKPQLGSSLYPAFRPERAAVEPGPSDVASDSASPNPGRILFEFSRCLHGKVASPCRMYCSGTRNRPISVRLQIPFG